MAQFTRDQTILDFEFSIVDWTKDDQTIILGCSRDCPSVLSRFGTKTGNVHRRTDCCAFDDLLQSQATMSAVVAR